MNSKEDWSALLDDECSDQELDQLLNELDSSPESGEYWGRLCAAREVRSGTTLLSPQACITASVMSQLSETPDPVDAKVVDMAVLRANASGTGDSGGDAKAGKNIWKPLVGFAAAASVGAAAVMFVQPSGNQGNGLSNVAGGNLATRTSPVPVRQVATQVRTVAERNGARHQQLREYLMDHSNAMAEEGVGGTLRYARFAAHTADYRRHPEAAR